MVGSFFPANGKGVGIGADRVVWEFDRRGRVVISCRNLRSLVRSDEKQRIATGLICVGEGEVIE